LGERIGPTLQRAGWDPTNMGRKGTGERIDWGYGKSVKAPAGRRGKSRATMEVNNFFL